MAIAKMELVNIDGHISQLDYALLQCVKLGDFHPEIPDEIDRNGWSHEDENPYEGLLQKVMEVGGRANIDLSQLETVSWSHLRLGDIDQLPEKIQKFKDLNEDASELLKENENVEVSGSDVYRSPLIRFRIGRMPSGQLSGLKKLPENLCIHEEFPIEKQPYVICAYLTTASKAEEIDSFYTHLGFDRVLVPHDILEDPSSVGNYMAAMRDVEHLNIAEATNYMDKINGQLMELIQKKNKLTDHLNENIQTLEQIGYIQNMDVTFDELFASEFVEIRFGRLPKESFPKLEYYEDRMFVFESFHTDQQYYWGVYFTPTTYKAEIDGLFESLYFERIKIPSFVHTTPQETSKLLEKSIETGRKKIAEVTEEQERLEHKIKLYLYWTYARVKYLDESYNLRRFVTVYENVFHMQGYVPASKAEAFKKAINESSPHYLAFGDEEIPMDEKTKEVENEGDEEVDAVKITSGKEKDDTKLPPTLLENSWFAKPFEMFTNMYGIPAYNGFDPTPFVSVTYTILFGIMFGDVGQGLCLFLLGLYLSKKKKMQMGSVMARVGLSGAFFGLIYGEVFGSETLLTPMYEALGIPGLPYQALEDTNIILIFSVVLGIFLLLVSMLINIFIGFKQKNLERAVFGPNGIAGLIFYGTGLAAVGSLFILGENIVPTVGIIIGLLVPFFLMYFKEVFTQLASGKKIHLEEGVGSYILEGFFEMFEVVLSFISNTVSFLRVGGFVLSHAGMMLVVRQISEMVGGGSIIVLILGNIFVIALEGLLVSIQSLRLEFYEMFSHFMGDAGVPFTPIQIGKDSPLDDK